jgi:glycosyltransferase involved in cell wall biosynthesis/predicted  nucleic acid-binding Zn-ribbon protein
VYTWQRLRQELERHMLLEACFEQTASRRKFGPAGRRAWQDSGRRLRRVDASKLASGEVPDCEWWIAVAMKDPAAGSAVKYEETSYPSCAGNADWNATAFARDYVNPWLVKGMVTIGHRLSNDARLVDLAERTLAQSPARSADAGAALCVMGYQFLAQQNLAAGTVEAFDRRCTRFLARGRGRNPHQLRWRISVLFVLAKLWQAVGRFDRAIARFHECAADDPLEFSPLIATKSVEACLQLGLLHMALGDSVLCEADLARGIRIAQRAAQIDWIHAAGSVERPVDFGLSELAVVVERASACAYALGRIEQAPRRPGQWWWQHRRDRVTQLDRLGRLEADLIGKNQSAGEQSEQIRHLHRSLAAHIAIESSQATEIGRLHQVIAAKDAAVTQVGAEVSRLHAVVAAKDAAVTQVGAEVSRLHAVVAAKDAAVTQVGTEVSRLHAVVNAKDEAVAQVGAEVSRLHAVVKAKDEAVAQVGAEIARLHAVVAAKDEAVAQVGAEIARLNAVVVAKDEAVAQVGAEIARLNAVVVAKDEAVAQVGAEVARLHAVVVAKDEAVAKVGAELARLHVAIAVRDDANQALDEGIRRLSREAEDRQRTIGALQSEVTEFQGVVADRDAAAASLRVELEQERAALASNLGDVRRVCDQLAGAGAAVNSHAEGLRWIEAIAAERTAQLATIRDSRWFQLGEVLKRRSLGRTEIAFVLRLVSAMLRARVGRAFRKATSEGPVSPGPANAEGDGPALTSYAIQLPEPMAGPRVHIVHVLANFMTGGSSRLVVDLIERLGGRFRHRVVTSFVPTPLAYVGAEVGVIGLEASDETIRKCLAQGNPDLVHIYYWGDCDEPWYRRILDAAERLGCPLVENVNTPVHPLRSPRIARYVYVSKYVQQTFGDASHVEEVIYPGSDLALFAPRSPPEDDANTIGMVYRLERDKLNEEAIDPLIRALQLRPRTRAVVVGGGTLLDIFRRKVAAAGLEARFQFTDYVAYEKLPGLVAGMTLFVAPVWKESFGQVSTFAMSMGIPVVGYSAGAIPEIVDDPALLAEPGDSEGLAQIIVRMLNEPALRAAASARCRKQAASHSVETMVRRYEQLYGALVRLPA